MLCLIPVRTVDLTVLRTEESSENPEPRQARSDSFRLGPLAKGVERLTTSDADYPPHADTICQIIVDADTNIVAGTSTNGFNHKITGYEF